MGLPYTGNRAPPAWQGKAACLELVQRAGRLGQEGQVRAGPVSLLRWIYQPWNYLGPDRGHGQTCKGAGNRKSTAFGFRQLEFKHQLHTSGVTRGR